MKEWRPAPRRGTETIIRPGRESFHAQVTEFLRYRELLYFFVWKNLKVRYAQAVLGAAWAVLQPLLTALILSVVLGRFARLPSDGAPPFVFYLAAMVPWTFFASAVSSSANSLVAHQSLIMKTYFPRLCLPIAGVLSALVDLIVPLILLLVIMAALGELHISADFLALPLLVLMAAMTAGGLGIGLAAVNLRYRDVAHALPFAIQMLFFASPIIYSVSQLPSEWRNFYFLNPMAAVIDGFRAILLNTHTLSPTSIGIGFCSAAVILMCGIAHFQRTAYRFADIA